MKRILFLGLIITVIIGGCTQKSKFPQGAWQLVSVKQMSGDTIVSEFPGEYTGSDILIFSGQHILSVGRFKRDTTFIDNYVGATYKLDGNRLEETLLYSPNSNMVGKKVKQILEFRNDTLIKTYPYNDNWELIKNGYTIEKLVRLE
jgi:hypothetical protein